MTNDPLLAFFNHPGMLGWLALAAAPLLIHLLSRRRYREMPWAAMQYLLAAVRKSARRMRIEQWLLLAVRTAIIVSVVAALAEPSLENAGIGFVSGQRTHKLFVLDASYSMAYRAADKTLFERAKELAARIVDESSQGDAFTLVLLASPPRVVVGTPAFERAAFHAELDHLRAVDGGADLAATLVRVEEVLDTARRDATRLTRHEIYFFTDLGKNTWLPNSRGAEAAAEFRQRSERLANHAAIVVADLGQDGAENLAIESFSVAEPYATTGRELTFESVVRNYGRTQHTRQLVELYVDGRRAGEDHVDLPPGAAAQAVLTYRFDTPGEHQLEVRLAGGDLLDVDNHRWRALPVAGKLRVLCVNGKPSGGTYQGATDYLVVALAPYGSTDDRGPVYPEVAPESALVEIDLDPYNCIFLANVGQFTANEARVLAGYVEHGGGLVFFLGDQVQAASYNRHLTKEEGGVGVLPARLGDKVVSERPCYPDPLDYRHRLVAPFRGRERAGLLNTPIFGYFKLVMPYDSRAQVAMKLSTGDPAIVEEMVGKGRSIVVATSADASWTTMPTWPSFVPIVQELLSLAVSRRNDDRNVIVGQPLGAELRTLASETPVSIETPGGESHAVRLVSEGDYNRWSYADTGRSGLYRVGLGAPLARNEVYAVNVDASEGDLTKLDLNELRSDVWSGVPYELFDGHDLTREAAVPLVHHDALDRWLLYAALGLVLSETALASWFGRRSS
jgi:uncharacterized membrane protein